MNHHALSRRELLIAAGATALAGIAPAAAAYDVIVVGAGPAGIAAARTIQSHGRSVLVLEATDRIGGRVETGNTFAAPFDLGAQFLSATATGNALHTIAKRSGLRTIHANAVPLAIANGEPALGVTYASLLTALVTRGDLAADGAIDDTSAYDAIHHLKPLPRFGVARSLLAAHGAPLEQISLIDYHRLASHAPAPLLYPADDTEYVPSGMGNVIVDLSNGLPIALNAPVTSVAYGNGIVELRTKAGQTYRARTAIVTASTGVLASRSIAFAPALPAAHQTAIQALPMGSAYKAALGFAKNPSNANHSSPKSTMHTFIDTEHPSLSFVVNPFEKPMIIVNATGDTADRFEKMQQDDVAALILATLEPLYPGATAAWDGDIQTSTWNQNPYTRGASSYATIGNAAARATLAEPINNKLWFAGEATSSRAPGQLHGAWEAGVHAAHDALAALGVRAASLA